ncbi:hypothetical protein SERLA73DRAFT_160859 [Serpula lacrymans var. lacrymans S7.3]|uniref:Uncharacterized protein n=1 Tax=Serpula lacrymans var. lacrymans (strain S7.3) TaxID=936435 RepID=F8Q0E7_SERL3|nr:hypothetical protein SERLA73DRAFT_160859 [Serpula lacrymans var. lacrymans S7.3]
MSNLEYRDLPEPSNSTDSAFTREMMDALPRIETPPRKNARLEAYVKQEVEKAIRQTQMHYQSQLDEALEETKKEIRNEKDATRVRAAQSDKTSAVSTAGESLKSAAFTIEPKIPTPDAANSTEENAAETVEERSGTPLKKPRTEVWTPEWVVDRLRDQKEERSIGILSAWTHKKKNERSNPGNDQKKSTGYQK